MAAGAPSSLDPRRNVFRDDLASADLKGEVTAQRYVEGQRRIVTRSAVGMRDKPDAALGFSNELLFGETVHVFDTAADWSWVQVDRDRYVGYVPTDTLSECDAEPTHRVGALGTIVYARADIKSPALMHLSLNSRVRVLERTEQMSRIAPDGWIVDRHLWDRTRCARDFVEVAERFIGVPYLWGGRSRLGIDCSGLIQIAMESAGLSCPRDSDMQRAELGTDVAIPADLEGLLHGDLVFWRGHVGVMSDTFTLLHANAHHMSVVAEPLIEAAARIAKTGATLSAIKRLDRLAAPLRP
jgi:cell wall-associated NlpC family hydrolase